MAAIVCQSSRIHRLMLASPKPPPQQPFKSCLWENNYSYKPDTTTAWTSIEALSSTVSNYEYEVSLLRLSPKSLELCTENLGNETGCDDIITETGIELLSSSSSSSTREQKSRKAREAARSFPPPLTTIRGSESIRVRPHREGGRLVLQLTKVPSCFQAQRSPGRLRLCFWTDIQTQEHEDEEDDDGRGWEHTKGCNSWVENNYERQISRCKEEANKSNCFFHQHDYLSLAHLGALVKFGQFAWMHELSNKWKIQCSLDPPPYPPKLGHKHLALEGGDKIGEVNQSTRYLVRLQVPPEDTHDSMKAFLWAVAISITVFATLHKTIYTIAENCNSAKSIKDQLLRMISKNFMEVARPPN
ncbi:Protein FANTASTIC FOUR 3 [Glycine soja]